MSREENHKIGHRRAALKGEDMNRLKKMWQWILGWFHFLSFRTPEVSILSPFYKDREEDGWAEQDWWAEKD